MPSSVSETDELLPDFFNLPGVIPSRYSSAEHGRKPTVKSQGSYGTCWALAATSALESALLPEERIVFSADHLALHNAFTVPVNDGGDARMTMAYLSGWQGPVAETEDPYGDGYSPDGLSPVVHVQEIQLLDGADRQEIKRAVQKYGAVQTSLYLTRETVLPDAGYYNEWTAAYYNPQEETQNHEILILGWDDSFSRFLFAQVPDVDGAFICQNSWGEEFGDQGIFYVSYADAAIAGTAMVYTKIEPTDNYDRIYQTDDCGWRGRQGYDDGECWFANVYRAGDGEQLAAAGFYAVGEHTSYELYLVEAPSGTADFSNRRLLKSGTFLRSGYYTVELSEEIPLKNGEQFALLVKISTPGVKNPVAVEYRGDTDTKNVTTDGKYGFISHDGVDWDHTEKKYGSNVCLKAYTRTSE
ncbi:MAG: lectin like domain-containing protein [Lachnospiraceae bacterium]|nr:lectin like domain-containing protein [Lachnospiraceae bacterium]